MLSIGKLSAGQHSYYSEQVAQGRDDYYADSAEASSGEAPGRWVGAAAVRLGLGGEVSADQLTAVVEARDPSDLELARSLRDGQAVKVPGYDLTFSAPKSVSVLATIADDGIRDALLGAHDAAIDAAIAYLEREAVCVRRGKGGRIVEHADSGVLGTGWRHRMSRLEDPQLHTHVVIANLARGSDGRWTSLWGKPLYAHAAAAGTIYQAVLREHVRARTGLEWGEVVNGAAELRDMPTAVMEHFSKRKAEIDVECERLLAKERAEAVERGEDPDQLEQAMSHEGREIVAYKTRTSKAREVKTEPWREYVRAQAAEHGLDTQALEQLLERGRARLERGEAVRLAIDEQQLGDQLAGPAGLTVTSNTFERRHVVRAIAAAMPQGASVEQIEQVARRFVARPDVLLMVDGTMTVQGLVDVERRVIQASVERAGEGAGRLDEAAIAAGVAAAPAPLTPEQEQAVRGILASGNGVDAIEARAGTGKTFAAGVIAGAYQAAGVPVVGAAPTGRARDELADGTGVTSSTIDSLLLQLDAEAERQAQIAELEQQLRRAPTGAERRLEARLEQLRAVPAVLPENGVLLLDEAGMTSTRKAAAVLEAARERRVKVVAIGDSGQLPSVEAGGWLKAVSQRVGAHELHDTQRQRDRDEARALGALHGGDAGQWVAWARAHGALQACTLPDEAVAEAIKQWQTAVAEVGDHHLAKVPMITPTNERRDQLNREARAIRRRDEKLGPDVAFGEFVVAEGDRVICRRNERELEVNNGTRGTVEHATREGVMIATDGGGQRWLPAAYVAEDVEYAYALTVHATQGATFERSILVASPGELSQELAYTMLTRDRGGGVLLVDGAPVIAAQREREQIAPQDLEIPSRGQVLAQLQERMQASQLQEPVIDRLMGERTPTVETAELDLDALARDAGRRIDEQPDAYDRFTGLDHETRRAQTELDALPLTRLDALAEHEKRRDQLASARDGALEQLEQLPAAPEPRRLGRPRPDPHAEQRRHLEAQARLTGDQLEQVQGEIKQRVVDLGDVGQLRHQRAELESRVRDLDIQRHAALDQLVDEQLQRQPQWLTQLLGERSEQPEPAERFDHAAREAARYRIEHHIPHDTPGIGPKPTNDPAQTAAWRHASRAIDQHRRSEITYAEQAELERLQRAHAPEPPRPHSPSSDPDPSARPYRPSPGPGRGPGLER